MPSESSSGAEQSNHHEVEHLKSLLEQIGEYNLYDEDQDPCSDDSPFKALDLALRNHVVSEELISNMVSVQEVDELFADAAGNINKLKDAKPDSGFQELVDNFGSLHKRVLDQKSAADNSKVQSKVDLSSPEERQEGDSRPGSVMRQLEHDVGDVRGVLGFESDSGSAPQEKVEEGDDPGNTTEDAKQELVKILDGSGELGKSGSGDDSDESGSQANEGHRTILSSRSPQKKQPHSRVSTQHISPIAHGLDEVLQQVINFKGDILYSDNTNPLFTLFNVLNENEFSDEWVRNILTMPGISGKISEAKNNVIRFKDKALDPNGPSQQVGFSFDELIDRLKELENRVITVEQSDLGDSGFGASFFAADLDASALSHGAAVNASKAGGPEAVTDQASKVGSGQSVEGDSGNHPQHARSFRKELGAAAKVDGEIHVVGSGPSPAQVPSQPGAGVLGGESVEQSLDDIFKNLSSSRTQRETRLSISSEDGEKQYLEKIKEEEKKKAEKKGWLSSCFNFFKDRFRKAPIQKKEPPLAEESQSLASKVLIWVNQKSINVFKSGNIFYRKSEPQVKAGAHIDGNQSLESHQEKVLKMGKTIGDLMKKHNLNRDLVKAVLNFSAFANGFGNIFFKKGEKDVVDFSPEDFRSYCSDEGEGYNRVRDNLGQGSPEFTRYTRSIVQLKSLMSKDNPIDQLLNAVDFSYELQDSLGKIGLNSARFKGTAMRGKRVIDLLGENPDTFIDAVTADDQTFWNKEDSDQLKAVKEVSDNVALEIFQTKNPDEKMTIIPCKKSSESSRKEPGASPRVSASASRRASHDGIPGGGVGVLGV